MTERLHNPSEFAIAASIENKLAALPERAQKEIVAQMIKDLPKSGTSITVSAGRGSNPLAVKFGGDNTLAYLYRENPRLIDLAMKYIGKPGLPHPASVGEVLDLRDLWALVLSHVEGHPKEVSESLALNLHLAVPYLWNADLFLTAASIKLPPHIVGQRLPTPLVWFTFDRRLHSFPGIEGEDDLECVGVLLAEGDSAMGAWFVRGSMNTGTTVYPRKLVFGSKYPEDCDESWRALLAALSFMNSPYISERQQGLPRHERKRRGLGRAEDQEPRNMLHYIDLRPPASHESEEGAGSVQWKCRWLVRCHQRAQWYPSLNSHKIIWIKPFIKGPEGAPLRTPTYRVRR